MIECLFCGQRARAEQPTRIHAVDVRCECVSGCYRITGQAKRELERRDVSQEARHEAAKRVKAWIIEQHEAGEEIPVVKARCFGFGPGTITFGDSVYEPRP